MLLVEPFFQQFTGKKLVDAADSTEAIVTILLDSRQQVDELVDKALAAGAGKVNDPYVEEGMYGRSFSDLDGHQWEAVHMIAQGLDLCGSVEPAVPGAFPRELLAR